MPNYNKTYNLSKQLNNNLMLDCILRYRNLTDAMDSPAKIIRLRRKIENRLFYNTYNRSTKVQPD